MVQPAQSDLSSRHLVPVDAVGPAVSSKADHSDPQKLQLATRGSLDGKPKCLIFGCTKPTWTGEPMEFCSRQCREEWWMRGQPPFGPPPPDPPLPPIPRPSLSCAHGAGVEPAWEPEDKRDPWQPHDPFNQQDHENYQEYLALVDEEKKEVEAQTTIQIYWILGTFALLTVGWIFTPSGLL
mmetsp:Transcript_30425/g.70054  ORF Transcript_30425/g.70054 Transcript_30425/m.70054 type:complete len:181 (-) Transcript_30425:128-670(-)